MTELNLCDLRCPKKMMMALRYRQDMAGRSNPLSKLTTNVSLGLRGAAQAGRAALTCPSRNLPDDEWHAWQECLDEAQRIADGMPGLTREALTEGESAALERIVLKDDPPASID